MTKQQRIAIELAENDLARLMAKRLARKYTRLRKAGSLVHRVDLKIGVQSFSVNGSFLFTANEAAWLRRQLGIALARFLLNESSVDA